jgi:hypothetical protein
MVLIGDVHGKINSYWKIIQKLNTQKENSIQLGDFGFKKEHEWHLKNINSEQHKILLGNHDHPDYIHSPHSLGNFGMYEGIFFIRGAYSIDQHHRVLGRDWWPEEEMNWGQWNGCLELYQKVKPKIVISHAAPTFVHREMWNMPEKSITSEGLEQCFHLHQPEQWYFGHYHKSKEDVIEGTYFRCLQELETINLF